MRHNNTNRKLEEFFKDQATAVFQRRLHDQGNVDRLS